MRQSSALFFSFVVAVCSLAPSALTGKEEAEAAVVLETEGPNGPETGVPQFIPASAFTLPVPDDTFPLGFPTATILAASYFVPVDSVTRDSDTFQFFANGGYVVVDVKAPSGPDLEGAFVGGGFFLSFLDANCSPRPGSILGDPFLVSCREILPFQQPFLGPIPPDTFFVPSFGPSSNPYLVTPIHVPGPGLYSLSLHPEFPGVSGPYEVEISVQNPIPAPSSLFLILVAIAGLASVRVWRGLSRL